MRVMTMKAFNSDEIFDIMEEAAREDERTEEEWLWMQADEDFETLNEFFDKEYRQHYDTLSDEFIAGDPKALKKILRGKDMVRLIESAFMLGRLVGRAEYTLAGV